MAALMKPKTVLGPAVKLSKGILCRTSVTEKTSLFCYEKMGTANT